MNILLVFLMLIIIFVIVFYYEHKIKNLSAKSKNNVHFYIARDKDEKLWLYIGKPIRIDTVFASEVNINLTGRNFYSLDLNKNDYDNLKWEDEPIEVFLNIKE